MQGPDDILCENIVDQKDNLRNLQIKKECPLKCGEKFTYKQLQCHTNPDVASKFIENHNKRTKKPQKDEVEICKNLYVMCTVCFKECKYDQITMHACILNELCLFYQ